MPSLFRILFMLTVITAGVYGGLWFLAVHHEPVQHDVSKPLPGLKIRRE